MNRCISRQLWWGHRIPAYHVSVPSDPSFATHSTDENTFWVCGKSPADALLAAHTRFPNIPTASIVLRQDEDVLDTWFSAGLFPFSTMGWPQQSAADLARFYPGSLLETGHDILFFWVARMVMMGLELTDSLPFTTVYLHAMVRDKFGRKMRSAVVQCFTRTFRCPLLAASAHLALLVVFVSVFSKSLGNVVDPLDVIDGITLQQLNAKLLQGNLDPSEVTKATEGQRRDFPDGITACGADALRFGLLAYSAQGRDVNLDIQRVVAYSHFGNKLWQATRFALLNFDPSFQKPQSLHDVQQLVKAAGGFGDRFILSRLAAAVQRANAGFEQYQFAEVTTAVYNFWLYELCDVYLELIKPVVKSTDTSPVGVAARQSALAVLYTCLRSGLLLLHPLMPFISEELWHRLPQAMTTEHQKSGTGGRQHCGSIMVELYPTVEAFSVFVDTDMEQLHGVIEEIAKSARSTRATLGLTRKRVDMYLLCSDQQTALQLSPHIRDIGTLSIANAVNILTADQRSTLPAGCTSSVVSPTIELFIPLKGLVDFGAELVKLEKQLTALQAAIQLQKEKMAAAGYEKTKQEVQARNADKLAADESEVVKLQASIDNFNGLMSSEEVAAYEVQKIVIRQADAERVRVGMEKIVPVGGDETKLNKKIAGKYAELKSEYGELLREIERLKIKQQQQSQKS